MVIERANAKVNLSLEITGRLEHGPYAGYHALESLVVFPQIGDRIIAQPARDLSLEVTGPRVRDLAAVDQESNLVMLAARGLRSACEVTDGAAIILEKHLPSASGIGGGSADAAATLRALVRLWQLAPDAQVLANLALSLGADVPVSLAGEPAMMSGIGQDLQFVEDLPQFWMVLVNCGAPVSTPKVFAALNAKGLASETRPALPRFATLETLLSWLEIHPNHLEAPAAGLEPTIAHSLQALQNVSGVKGARMSGSGATCFGLFETKALAESAAKILTGEYPDWWVVAALVPAASRSG